MYVKRLTEGFINLPTLQIQNLKADNEEEAEILENGDVKLEGWEEPGGILIPKHRRLIR